MAHKQKQTYPCNLQKLRECLGLTQKQLGEILEVSERMICKYEIGEVTLPIDKAIMLSRKYGYTIDWIYKNPVYDYASAPVCTEKEYPKFLVNIRDFISYSNGLTQFTIPNYYMEYIKERNRIESSKEPADDKKRKLAELDGKYKIQKQETKYWRISLKYEEISTYLRFDSKFIPFADYHGDSASEPTKEELEEIEKVASLLKEEITLLKEPLANEPE